MAKKEIGKLVTDSIAPPIVIPVKPAKPLLAKTTSKPYSLDSRMGKESITTITPANGLPAGYYFDVVQDKTGNLWFQTTFNIIKYDGHSFVTYPLVPGENVQCDGLAICGDELWALIRSPDSTGTVEVTRLYAFNGASFEPLPVRQSAFDNRIGSYGIRLFPMSDGTIWVVLDQHKQILKFEGRKLKLTITPSDFPFHSIFFIEADRQGNTWFIDREDTTITLHNGKTFEQFTHADGVPSRPASLLPVSADSLYVSTSIGTYFFDGRSFKKINDDFRSYLLADKQGTLWYNSSVVGGSFSKVSSYGTTFIGREDGLDVSENFEFGFDRDDNVWVWSKSSVNRLYKPVTTYTEIFPLVGILEWIRAFYHDRQGNYWFGSFQTGVSYYNGKTLTNYMFPEYGNKVRVRTDNNIGRITQDNTGNLWITTFGNSLIKFDGRSFYTNNSENGFTEDLSSRALLADSKGNIWYPRINAGVVCFNGKEKIVYTTAQGLCNNDVFSILEDRTGAMWFGTTNGLSRLKNGQFTTYNVEDGLINKVINEIAEDEYGNLWLSTDGGLSRFDGEHFSGYTDEDGLIAGSLLSIKKDSSNGLYWLASEVGFSAMTIKANHPDSVTFENYSESMGYPLNGTYLDFMVDHTGALWANEGNNSIKRFDYRKAKEASKPFALHISQIRLNNEAVCWSYLNHTGTDSLALPIEMRLRFGKLLNRAELEQKTAPFEGVRYDSLIPFDFIPYHLSLPYKANSISFDFAAIDPHFSKSTRYQYMLEGFDKTWSPLSNNTNANFGNLREGRYVFRLKALNPYGIWSELSYSFTVLPPWYRTWWSYTLYILLFVSGVFLFIRWRTRALQQEKIHLEEKVAVRTSELNQSLNNLKATQSQLIQSEKMASLGELTAGIAHEIQNPLNFVNNFSEVNSELATELLEAATKADLEEVKTIATSIKENEDKITQHGKRADGIVKSMLQHSRKSTGQKELTDINALCDEYLRLAYHGLRAKDKSFNAKFETNFDPAVGNITVLPQEIGRVILNLINNAFHAVTEKKKTNGGGYEPTVSVTTKRQNGSVEISVTDNGTGIPSHVKDKIFQPFFTTKPTGQGTGLGLSLSYDIVTKGHQGELKVVTREGEGSTFIVHLPAS